MTKEPTNILIEVELSREDGIDLENLCVENNLSISNVISEALKLYKAKNCCLQNENTEGKKIGKIKSKKSC